MSALARAPRELRRRLPLRERRASVCAAQAGRVRAVRLRSAATSCRPTPWCSRPATRRARRYALAGRGRRADGSQGPRARRAHRAPAAAHRPDPVRAPRRPPRLPPAFYELKSTGKGRAVYCFCMCPGGWIVPAATEPDGVVVNGMSLSRRDSPFANSGLVVEVRSADFGRGRVGRPGGSGLPAPHRGGRLSSRRRRILRPRPAVERFPRRPRQCKPAQNQLPARA